MGLLLEVREGTARCGTCRAGGGGPGAAWGEGARKRLEVTPHVLAPGRHPLAQTRGLGRELGGQVLALLRIGGEVVELVVAGGGVVDVLPLAFTDAQAVVVVGGVEIGPGRAGAVEQAAPAPRWSAGRPMRSATVGLTSTWLPTVGNRRPAETGVGPRAERNAHVLLVEARPVPPRRCGSPKASPWSPVTTTRVYSARLRSLRPSKIRPICSVRLLHECSGSGPCSSRRRAPGGPRRN